MAVPLGGPHPLQFASGLSERSQTKKSAHVKITFLSSKKIDRTGLSVRLEQ